jgi:biotin transport system ATP-binding protein/energy-coupling factor transport system ATP-binding protein
MIKIEGVTFKYDQEERPALTDVSFQIEEGAYVGMIGPNGCGKTTLIKHLNGLLIPSEGNVWVDGLNSKDAVAVQEIRQKVGMIFQNPDNQIVGMIRQKVGMIFQNPDNQIVGMSVEEDVSFGPGNLELPPNEIRDRVQNALALVGLEGYEQRPPHTLSGGEKQLVAIAGVLAMNPSYIALDEPTSFLDPSGRRKVLEVIGRLNDQGITIVHITHDMDEIVHADHVIVLEGGKLLLKGDPRTVFTHFEWLSDLGLGTPKVTELMWRFKQMGSEIRHDILTVDEAWKEISAFIERKLSAIP